MPKRRRDESTSSSSSEGARSRRAASPETSSDSDAEAAPGPTRSAAAEALFKWAKAGTQGKDLKEDASRRPANGAENGSSRRKDVARSQSKDRKSAKDKGKQKKETAKDTGKEKSKSKTEKDRGKDIKKKDKVDEKKDKSKAKKANGEDRQEKAGKDKQEKAEKPKASPSASPRGPSAERARPKAEDIEQELDRLRGALAGAGRAGVPAPAAANAALSGAGSPLVGSSAVPKVAPASAIAEDYFVVPPVGRKMPPCELPVWCVIPNPDDIEIGVEILRRTIDGRVAPKRLLLGKRAWVLLGRRLPEGLATGPEPDIGLAAPRASRAHVLLLRNWMGQVFLMDLGSTHGTYLDGQRLKPREAVRWKVGVEAFFADRETEVFELRPAG